MSLLLRPTFVVPLNLDRQDAFDRIKTAVDALPDDLVGQFRQGHGMVSISDQKRHFWSPWLHLHVVKFEEQQDELFGRFSPHPSIWTAVMFSYLSLSVIIFFLVIIALSQTIANESPWAWAGIPVCLLIAVVLWLVSQAGQRLAHDEMQMMQSVVEDALLEGK